MWIHLYENFGIFVGVDLLNDAMKDVDGVFHFA